MPVRSRFDCQTTGEANAARAGLARYAPRQALSPVFFVEAPGAPVFRPPAKSRGGWSAARRVRILPCRASFRKRGRLSALHGGDF